MLSPQKTCEAKPSCRCGGRGGGGERGWKEATKSSVTKDLSSRVVSTHICIRYGCIQLP